MNAVVDAFLRLTPSNYKTSPQGWLTFPCPVCGDNPRKKRGGFYADGYSWSYRCFNGGCEFEKPLRWEQGGFFGARHRRLYELLGGNVADLPRELFESKSRVDPTALLETATDFASVDLPPQSQWLFVPALDDREDVDDCRTYLLRRSINFFTHPVIWSPKYARWVILPLIYYRNQVIGWIARAIDPNVDIPHLKSSPWPRDYLYNQNFAQDYPICLVQESPFDSLALTGCATFSNTISQKQINFLHQVRARGRKVVLLPDFHKQDWRNYLNTAKQNGFYLSVPDYPNSGSSSSPDHIKDAGESISTNGTLRTLEVIIEGITLDYHLAETKLSMRSRI